MAGLTLTLEALGPAGVLVPAEQRVRAHPPPDGHACPPGIAPRAAPASPFRPLLPPRARALLASRLQLGTAAAGHGHAAGRA